MRKQQFDHDSVLIVSFRHGKARRFRPFRDGGRGTAATSPPRPPPRGTARGPPQRPIIARDPPRDLVGSRYYGPAAPTWRRRDDHALGAVLASSARHSTPDAPSFGGPTEQLTNGDTTPKIRDGTSPCACHRSRPACAWKEPGTRGQGPEPHLASEQCTPRGVWDILGDRKEMHKRRGSPFLVS